VNKATNSGATPLGIAAVSFLKILRHKKLWNMILSFIFLGVIAFVFGVLSEEVYY